jgi:3-oxoacyl-(acyl-carrier-protein) synthase
MRRVVVTGMGVVSAAGAGVEPFRAALEAGEPLGSVEPSRRSSGRCEPFSVARLGRFDPGEVIRPGALRKMSPESQLVTATFLWAWKDAGTESRPVPAERTGTFLGTGFGCMGTTAAFLREVLTEEMAAASPFLFSELLPSAPLGHAAIALDARGQSVALAVGDVSCLAAVGEGWRAVRSGRLDRAVCGGFDLVTAELAQALSRLSSRSKRRSSAGEGSVAFVLEDRELALSTGADVIAELIGIGEAGDPVARPTDWSRDPHAWTDAHGRALGHAPPGGLRLGTIVRHAPTSEEAALAEDESVRLLPAIGEGARIFEVHRIFGHHAAAGGLSVAAGLLACRQGAGPVMVSAGSWGGATAALLIASSAA